MIGTRPTTGAFTTGMEPVTEGKRGGAALFPPDHPDSRLMVGVEATHVLRAIYSDETWNPKQRLTLIN